MGSIQPIASKDRIPYKRLTKDELNEDGMMNLIGGICREALYDYIRAVKAGNQSMMESGERFFRGHYFRVK